MPKHRHYWPTLQHSSSIAPGKSVRSTPTASQTTGRHFCCWSVLSSTGWRWDTRVAHHWRSAWGLPRSSRSCGSGFFGKFDSDLLAAFGGCRCSKPLGSIWCLLSWSIMAHLVARDLICFDDLLRFSCCILRCHLWNSSSGSMIFDSLIELN